MRVNFIWKGKYSNPSQLAETKLPKNAVQFKEPKNMLMVNLVASLFVLPILVVVITALVIKEGGLYSFYDLISITGMILGLLLIIPHEFMHGIAFPKGADVYVWYSLKNLVAFVHTTAPMTKKQFIFVSLLPNMIFGFLPFIIWLLLPYHYLGLSRFLFSVSLLNLLMGCGDYMNVFNAMRQMPKGSKTVLAGFHSYWYIDNK